MNKYLRISEYTWLVLTVLAAGTTAFYFYMGNQDNGVLLAGITVFSAIMYNMRRMFNRRLLKEAKRREEEASKPKPKS